MKKAILMLGVLSSTLAVPYVRGGGSDELVYASLNTFKIPVEPITIAGIYPYTNKPTYRPTKQSDQLLQSQSKYDMLTDEQRRQKGYELNYQNNEINQVSDIDDLRELTKSNENPYNTLVSQEFNYYDSSSEDEYQEEHMASLSAVLTDGMQNGGFFVSTHNPDDFGSLDEVQRQAKERNLKYDEKRRRSNTFAIPNTRPSSNKGKDRRRFFSKTLRNFVKRNKN